MYQVGKGRRTRRRVVVLAEVAGLAVVVVAVVFGFLMWLYWWLPQVTGR